MFDQNGRRATDDRATPYRRFLAVAEAHPRRTAFVFETSRVSYGDLRRRVESLAAGLIRECGLQMGDPIALVGGDCADWPLASLAIQAAAGVEVPARGLDDEGAAATFFAVEGPRVTFVSGDVPFTPYAGHVVHLTGAAASTTLTPLLAAGRAALAADAELVRRRQAGITPDDVAAIIRTSGTTGPPKRVRLSGRNLAHAGIHVPELLEIGPDDVFLSVLPLWHLYGRIVLNAALGSGACLVQTDYVQLESQLRAVRPTLLPGFPLMWERIHRRILDRLRLVGARGLPVRAALVLARLCFACRDVARGWRPGSSPRRLLGLIGWLGLWAPWWLGDRLLLRALRRPFGDRFRAAIIGDAPLPLAVDRGLRAMGLTVLEGYGSTEQGVSALRTPGRNVPGMVGPPLPEVELRLLDAGDEEVTPPGRGEIVVAGPQICHGYAVGTETRPAPTVSLDGRCFLRTGDVGCIDATGSLGLIGRVANRLVLPGQEDPVSPEPVESALLASAYVAQAMLTPFGEDALGLLLVPAFEHRPMPGRGLAPNAPQWVSVYRRVARRHLRPWRHLPVSVFWLARAPLVPGDTLTVTLKLRRDAIRRRVLPGLPAHPL